MKMVKTIYIDMKYPDDFIDNVILGDFSVVQGYLPSNCIDLVLADPPYPKQWTHCFEFLALYCPRLMKRGASLVTLLGHYQLETVMGFFQDRLKYRWIHCVNQEEHSHPRMAMGVEVCWKPALHYVKEAYPSGRGFMKDMVHSETKKGVKKENHKWEQPEDVFEYFIRKLTNEGDVILDPYFGSGTTGIVARKLNRHFIGIDCDILAVETAKELLQLS